MSRLLNFITNYQINYEMISKNLLLFPDLYNYFFKGNSNPLLENIKKNIKYVKGKNITINLTKIKNNEVVENVIKNYNSISYETENTINHIEIKYQIFFSLLNIPFKGNNFTLLSKNSSYSIVFINEDKDKILKIICNNNLLEIKATLFHYIIYIYYFKNLSSLNKTKNIFTETPLKYLCYIDHFGIINNLSPTISDLFHRNECKKSENQKNDKFYFCTLENGGEELKNFCFNIEKDLDIILEVMLQCAESVSLIHFINYVHMDIKLENFLLYDNIKIIDFGFINEVGTKGMSFIGTPNYKCLSLRNLDNETYDIIKFFDIYSLACVFIQLLLKKEFLINNFILNFFIKNEKLNEELNEHLFNYFITKCNNIYHLGYFENKNNKNNKNKIDKIISIITLIINMLNPKINKNERIYYPSLYFYKDINNEDIEKFINIKSVINEIKRIINIKSS